MISGFLDLLLMAFNGLIGQLMALLANYWPSGMLVVVVWGNWCKSLKKMIEGGGLGGISIVKYVIILF